MNSIQKSANDGATKRVSIVMCTYNGEQYIQEQLDSILAQTYPLYEIIIQDDGSTDSTWQILQQYQSQYPIIRLSQNTGKHGVNSNFFSALRLATGDYIAISDQDDIWMPNKIEKQVAVLDGGAMLCYHPSPSFIGDDKNHTIPYDRRIPTNAYPRLLATGCMPGHTMLFRKELLEYLFSHLDAETLDTVGEGFFYDSILDMALLTQWDAVYINDPLTLHRRLATSATAIAKYSDRSILSAIRQIASVLPPSVRKKCRPMIERRWSAMRTLLEHFPEARDRTVGVIAMINAYSKGTLPFVAQCVKNKDDLFFAREKNALIATVRAVLFPLMMYNYFANRRKEIP